MRASRILLLSTLVFMLGFGSVNAQAASSKVFAKIPFEFEVGGKTLPAGDYKFVHRTLRGIHPDVVLVQNRDTDATATVMTRPVLDWASPGQAKIVFHRYGNHYFLSQFWLGSWTGREIPESHRER